MLVTFLPISMADSSDDSSDDYNVYNNEKQISKQMLLCCYFDNYICEYLSNIFVQSNFSNIC